MVPRPTLRHRMNQAVDRWLFRLGAPETEPIVLRQRRIYVLPTRAGYGFALALLVMLIASLNYNLSLGYALTFLLGGMAIASIIHAFRNLLGISLRAGRGEPAFAGENAIFHLRVDNPRHRRRPALRLSTRDGDTLFDLAADESSEVSLTLPTHQRGVLPLGRTRIETTWPLGLIRAWSVFIPAIETIVYPAPEPTPPPLPARPAGNSSTGMRSTGGGDDDFTGLRSHQQSDSPRHLAWKAYARGGPLMTKQFAAVEGGEVELDWQATPDHLDDEARLSRLSAWLLAAEQSGARYALRLPMQNIPAAHGTTHLHRCLRALALFASPAEGARHAP